jgi:hypothetical protein
MELGGGSAENYAIEGVVDTIEYANGGSYGDPITGFKIAATILNDTATAMGDADPSDNSHGESRQAISQGDFYVGTLIATKLTAEFAVADTNLLPATFNDPYRQLFPYIVADNEDQLAWYCWNPQEPPQGSEAGNYYVPTWDFGDIPLGQSASRTLAFSVEPPMDSSDPRYGVIHGSLENETDLFANRTASLKISTWIDNLDNDTYGNPEGMLRSSDVSVFHDEEPPYDPPHKMHYPQLPDPNGWDVRACYWAEEDQGDGLRKVLADDFLCTSNGPITHITFWGSFQDDDYMDPLEDIVKFHLSLHADIPDPDGPGPEYSMPEVPALWEREIEPATLPPGWTVTVTPEAPSDQGWYDPNTGQWEHPNHTDYFRYEVEIPESEAFVQTEGTIYWLDISAMTEGSMWGWKTSRSEHFNDDAVWADLPVTNQMQWGELHDPRDQEISLDLAFVIDGGGGEPQEETDWGDAPDQPYSTLAANNGANHTIVPGIYLGSLIDGEPDGQPDPTATGDDLANLADEDGVAFTSLLVPGMPATVVITASQPGKMDAWIDYDSNGTWTPGEQLLGGSFALVAGSNTVNFMVPPTALPTTSTFARFRFSTAGGLPPFGPAADGEVEDYEVAIDELDWGDAPDPLYPTLAASGGANHRLAGGAAIALRLGWLIDGEVDGQPDPTATGDDLANLADEDGITFDTPLLPGTVAQITVYAGVNASVSGFARLQGWVDFNADGIWGPAEQIFTDQVVNFSGLANPTVLTFTVPGGATPGPTFARFRLSTVQGLGPTGYAKDGEVEDYQVEIEPAPPVDWGDAYDNWQTPVYPTLQANNGAHHVIVPGMFLGNIVDPEPDGQPNLAATGDDTDIFYPSMGDDEDGVFFTTLLQPGGYAGVKVVASAPGMLDAWIDFNNDGDWADTGERIFTAQPLNPGVNTLGFPVPATAVQGIPVVARFRYSSGGVASYAGLALDGEVEDYVVDIETIESNGQDFGDAPYVPETILPGGASHAIVPGIVLGATIDPEPDGQPSGADADDLMNLDDEDGVSFPNHIVAGSNATVEVVAGSLGGMLDAWIDFNADGDWFDSGEQIFSSQPVVPGLNTLSFGVPLPPPALGPTFARFRISSAGGLGPAGAALDGEVEDYMVELFQPQPTNLVITNLSFNTAWTVAMVEWISETGITYQMQATTNLMVSNSWIDVESTVVGPVNWQTNNMSAETNKFYHITAPWTE